MSSNREIRKLMNRLRDVERIARSAATTPQLQNASLENSSLKVYDAEGQEAQRIGAQPDGTFATVTVTGPPPPRPSAATVTDKNVGQASFTWDGRFEGDVPAPADLARVEVHLTATEDAELDLGAASSTLWGSIIETVGGTVTIKLDQGEWFVRLVARSLSGRTSEPSAAAPFEVKSILDRDEIVEVIEAAGGGFSIIIATAPPPDPDPDAGLRREGDLWWQRHPGATGATFAMWRWDSTQTPPWVPVKLDSRVMAYLNAAHIVGDLVQAVRIVGSGFIVAGDPDGANASMTADGFRAHGVTEEGVQYVSTRLGTGAEDALEIIQTAGEPPVASINTEGSFSGRSASFVGDVRVSGIPILGQTLNPAGPAGYFDFVPRGLVQSAAMIPVMPGTFPANTNTAAAWFQFDAYANRIYRLEVPWDGTLAVAGSPAAMRMTLRAHQTVASAAGQSAPEPTVSSDQVLEWTQYQPVVNGSVSDVFAFNWQPWTGATNEPRSVGIMLSIFPGGATFTPATTRAAAWTATITDIGPSDPAKMIAAAAPGSQAARRYVTTWEASTSRSWNGNGARINDGYDTSLMRQGLGANNAWPGHAHSAFLCNNNSPAGYDNATLGEVGVTMQTALTGAIIRKVEVFVYASSWRGPKDNALHLQPWDGGTSLPATHSSTANMSNRQIFGYDGSGVGQWMTVPSSWITPTVRGVQIGPLDALAGLAIGRSGNLAGSAWSTAATLNRPKLRVTYTR